MKEYKVISIASELSARKMGQQATMVINEHIEEGWGMCLKVHPE